MRLEDRGRFLRHRVLQQAPRRDGEEPEHVHHRRDLFVQHQGAVTRDESPTMTTTPIEPGPEPRGTDPGAAAELRAALTARLAAARDEYAVDGPAGPGRPGHARAVRRSYGRPGA